MSGMSDDKAIEKLKSMEDKELGELFKKSFNENELNEIKKRVEKAREVKGEYLNLINVFEVIMGNRNRVLKT